VVIKTTKGFFKLLTNIKDAFNKEEFERKYLDEYFNKDGFILGDISSSILRLKGFDKGNNYDVTIKEIDKYVKNDCAFHCPYYILQRISEAEFMETFKEEEHIQPYGYDLDIDKVYESADKIPFDFDSLDLESSTAVKPHIVLEMQRINKVVTFALPDDLKNLSNHGNKKSNSNSKKRDSNSIKSNEAKRERSKKAADKNSENGKTNKKPKRNKSKKNKQHNTNTTNNTQNKNVSRDQKKAIDNPNENKNNNKPRKNHQPHKKSGQNNQNPNTTQVKKGNKNNLNKQNNVSNGRPEKNKPKPKSKKIKVENSGGIKNDTRTNN